MIIKEEALRESSVVDVAKIMMTAARTAPKACGIDQLEMCVITGRRLKTLEDKMRKIGTQSDRDFFLRDAGNIGVCQAVVFIGTHINGVRGLNCGLCGSPTCKEKLQNAPNVPCTFAINDLGIALGSAVSVAVDHRVDCRIMYSAGVAAEALDMLCDCHPIYAIPLSVSGKNIFFDRKLQQ